MFSTTSKPGSVSPLASSTPTASATPAQPLNKKQQRQAKQAAKAVQATPTATLPVAPIATPVATVTVAPTGPTQALTGKGKWGTVRTKNGTPHTLPNSTRKNAVMQALLALGAVNPQTAQPATVVAAKAGGHAVLGTNPATAVRHYVYHSPGMAVAYQGIAGAKGYGFCLTPLGIATAKANGFAPAATVAPVAAPSVAANSTQATPAAKVA